METAGEIATRMANRAIQANRMMRDLETLRGLQNSDNELLMAAITNPGQMEESQTMTPSEPKSPSQRAKRAPRARLDKAANIAIVFGGTVGDAYGGNSNPVRQGFIDIARSVLGNSRDATLSRKDLYNAIRSEWQSVSPAPNSVKASTLDMWASRTIAYIRRHGL